MAFESSLIEQSYSTYLQAIASQLGVGLGIVTIFILVVAVWTLVWKGLALWKSAKKGSWIWFVIMLIINDMGILEILYLFIFSRIQYSSKKSSKSSKKK